MSQHVDPDLHWFNDHYVNAADQTIEFCESAGVELAGRLVADVGCGDGALSLGLANRARPQRLTGYDVALKTDDLPRRAEAAGVSMPPPSLLRFEASEPTRLPAASDTFDVVTTWSAFEHIADPLAVLSEIRRVLKPSGTLFLQLWPFYHSEEGSHLGEWFPDGFHHLYDPNQARTTTRMRSANRHAGWTDYMSDEYENLNRITIEELNRCILAAGLRVTKLELLTRTVQIPADLARYSMTDLGIGGVKLLAVAAGR